MHRFLGLIGFFFATQALAAEHIRVVPAYSGNVDDLIVFRYTWGDTCGPDSRPASLNPVLVDGTLTLTLDSLNTVGIGCGAALTPFESAWSFRDLGLSALPDQLTIRIDRPGDRSDRASFARTSRFDMGSPIATGWWKNHIPSPTLSIDHQGEQIGFLLTSHLATGESTWRIAGGPFGASKGRFVLYDSRGGDRLEGDWTAPDNRADGNLEFAFEGPSLVWLRYRQNQGWIPLRPFYFGIQTRRTSRLSLGQVVQLDGTWELVDSVVRVPEITIVERNPRPYLTEDPPAYSVQASGRAGSLECDDEGCRFDNALGEPFTGVLLPNEGMTRDTLSIRTRSGWEPFMRRVRAAPAP